MSDGAGTEPDPRTAEGSGGQYPYPPATPPVSEPPGAQPPVAQPPAPQPQAPQHSAQQYPAPQHPAPQPQGGQPHVAGQPVAHPPAPQPAPVAAGSPVSAATGGFVLATPYVPPTTSGMASGGLATGIASCVLGLLGCCWWPMAVLPGLMGAAAVVLGYMGVKQVAASNGQVTGRGAGIAAMVTGGVGLFLTLVALVIGVVYRAQQGTLFG